MWRKKTGTIFVISTPKLVRNECSIVFSEYDAGPLRTTYPPWTPDHFKAQIINFIIKKILIRASQSHFFCHQTLFWRKAKGKSHLLLHIYLNPHQGVVITVLAWTFPLTSVFIFFYCMFFSLTVTVDTHWAESTSKLQFCRIVYMHPFQRLELMLLSLREMKFTVPYTKSHILCSRQGVLLCQLLYPNFQDMESQVICMKFDRQEKENGKLSHYSLASHNLDHMI